ncbi:MAG: class I SAM-dependent methyltransferase [Acidobacteriota bacterium]|nr:class I SAM-dependent methyltransferase [Acidobacteriota bacterium]
MELTEVLNNPPKPHPDAQGGFMVMGLIEPALKFIYENVDESCTTLETGCGLSTVVFALTGSHHTVIAPAPKEFEITKAYCDRNGIPTGQIDFIAEASQKVLPLLKLPPLDLVLIDGGHGFPTPYIDWFYTASLLKNGGYLMVDDVWLWSCQILRDFLMEQPQWNLVAEFEGRTAVFKKLSDGAEWLEWTQQPRVARGGRLKWIDGELRLDAPQSEKSAELESGSTAIGRALGDLKKGNFKILLKKTAGRIRRS